MMSKQRKNNTESHTQATNEQQQLAWLARERATVWFGKDGVKVKVHDFNNPITARTLAYAIFSIEQSRKDRRDLGFCSEDLHDK